jgi:hypothetical protein
MRCGKKPSLGDGHLPGGDALEDGAGCHFFGTMIAPWMIDHPVGGWTLEKESRRGEIREAPRSARYNVDGISAVLRQTQLADRSVELKQQGLARECLSTIRCFC